MCGFGFRMNSVHNDQDETRWGNQPDKLRDKLCKAGVGTPHSTLPDRLLNL
jgi:hypothetical protein